MPGMRDRSSVKIGEMYRKEDRQRGEKPLAKKCYALLEEKLGKEFPERIERKQMVKDDK